MKDSPMNLKALPELLATNMARFTKHAIIVFVVFVALIYSFILYRISVLDSAKPSDQAVAAETKTPPHLNQDIIEQLQQLNDNSVAVHSLFDKARNNPFNE
ncbi:MAG TPA: hypothetical protein VFL85_02020 [Candidatus Saccharimonadales bacterium]|nr:hypothetical protein [Candidatus Saccharimonadales bacterium]